MVESCPVTESGFKLISWVVAAALVAATLAIPQAIDPWEMPTLMLDRAAASDAIRFDEALAAVELMRVRWAAQHDGLDAPAQWWQAGDLLVQEHLLPALDGDDIEIRLGVYDPQTGRRLLLPDGSDYYPLPQS